MTTHQTETQPSAVIQRNHRIFATQERARRALEEVRTHAWRLGNGLNLPSDVRETNAAHDLSDALAELVALALHVEDEDVTA